MNIYDQIDQAFAGGKSLFNAETLPGTTYEGTITGVDYRQTTDYNTGQPATFPSGDPKMQFVIDLEVPALIGPGDDGNRSLYINNWGGRKRALFQAFRDGGFTKASEALANGNTLTAKYVGEQTQQGKTGSYTEKVYEYTLTRGNPGLAAVDQEMSAPAPAQAVPAPAPVPVQQQTTPAPAAAAAAPAPAAPVDPMALIKAGMDDQTIAATTGLDPSVITILRHQNPA